VHNNRRLAEHRGATPAQTLVRFRRIVTSTTTASGHPAAWLGEVVVHAPDVRRPLGLRRNPPVEAVTEVARFYASRDFTVASRSMIKGLRLDATDGRLTTGAGPHVTGTTLALTMAMAGRRACCDELTGSGVPVLRERCSPTRDQRPDGHTVTGPANTDERAGERLSSGTAQQMTGSAVWCPVSWSSCGTLRGRRRVSRLVPVAIPAAFGLAEPS